MTKNQSNYDEALQNFEQNDDQSQPQQNFLSFEQQLNTQIFTPPPQPQFNYQQYRDQILYNSSLQDPSMVCRLPQQPRSCMLENCQEGQDCDFIDFKQCEQQGEGAILNTASQEMLLRSYCMNQMREQSNLAANRQQNQHYYSANASVPSVAAMEIENQQLPIYENMNNYELDFDPNFQNSNFNLYDDQQNNSFELIFHPENEQYNMYQTSLELPLIMERSLSAVGYAYDKNFDRVSNLAKYDQDSQMNVEYQQEFNQQPPLRNAWQFQQQLFSQYQAPHEFFQYNQQVMQNDIQTQKQFQITQEEDDDCNNKKITQQLTELKKLNKTDKETLLKKNFKINFYTGLKNFILFQQSLADFRQDDLKQLLKRKDKFISTITKTQFNKIIDWITQHEKNFRSLTGWKKMLENDEEHGRMFNHLARIFFGKSYVKSYIRNSRIRLDNQNMHLRMIKKMFQACVDPNLFKASYFED